MSDEQLKLSLIHQLNVLADLIESKWPGLTTKNVADLKQAIEDTFQVVCRRSKR